MILKMLRDVEKLKADVRRNSHTPGMIVNRTTNGVTVRQIPSNEPIKTSTSSTANRWG